MSSAISSMSRRSFLAASTVITLAAAVPAAASVMAGSGPVALASSRAAVPQGWQGPVVVLAGDYLHRLAQLRATLSDHAGREVILCLDGADSVLFDIANTDRRAGTGAAVLPAHRSLSGVAA